MYVMPDASPIARRLLSNNLQAMWEGIKEKQTRCNTSVDIGHAIQSFNKVLGYSVVRDYCGHGIGREMQ